MLDPATRVRRRKEQSAAKRAHSYSILGAGIDIVNTYRNGYSVYNAVQGNFVPAASLAVDKLSSLDRTKRSGMAPRIRNRRRRKRRMRGIRRRVPASLVPTTMHIKHVVPYAKTEGSQHRWYYTIRKNWLLSSFLQTFDEFKVLSITIRYVPNNATSETGLYAGVVLDRGGFGGYGSATAAQWFVTIGSMPGAKIRPRFVASVYRWKPTEPTVRDWVATDQNINYCTVYVCNNGKETDELGGLFDVTARVQARGLYYNATVKMFHQAKRGELTPSTGEMKDHGEPSRLSSPFERVTVNEGCDDLPTDIY